ncbi:cytochrome b/b6 domain-containing protein [Roseateles oligotrophus]|uniref:Cytochrome b/b6 domain-containing protein n=1 Tax=Roseateles oligotrophus TaxID=1769250 RepID=A0ABT2YDF4_9BURK|nr:cytochrome b/b6 domain-containing protein [Roseateles oligotrophus]MCV2368056.1 cytochrome b/b6 domain-containing protein [Roseateles oligotrophus]
MPKDLLMPVRIWDLPTRLFHWTLVACVLGSVISAKLGGNALVWHMRLGYAVLALVAFRIVWGLVGGRWSRFSSFVYSPAALVRYLRGRAHADDHFEVGHNPLGAYAVLAMLAWLLLQVGSGLIADDEIASTGPLIRFVSGEVSLAWTAYHKSYGQWGLFVLVGLHVAAIAFYRLRHRNDLIGPMFSGDKLLPHAVPAARDSLATRLFALTLLGACAAAVYLLIGLETV